MIQYSRKCLEKSETIVLVTASTNKRIIVRRFDREPVTGFVNPQSYLQQTGVEVLSQSGSVLLFPYTDIKALYFVRDFDNFEVESDPKVFNARPKMNGIWVRMRFRDGDVLEGLLANNLLLLDPFGFTVVPPGPAVSSQRVFVPRAALSDLQVLGVIGSPLRGRKPKPKPKEQIGLFD